MPFNFTLPTLPNVAKSPISNGLEKRYQTINEFIADLQAELDSRLGANKTDCRQIDVYKLGMPGIAGPDTHVIVLRNFGIVGFTDEKPFVEAN